jgi:hypothetical protein
MNTTQPQMEVMDQLTLQRVIDDLQKAFDVCDGVDYDANPKDYQKEAPFAVGYSRSALFAAIGDLNRVLANYK